MNSQTDVIFAKATGEGYDLPYGCIFYGEMKSQEWAGQNYIFWNPKGNFKSLDQDVQQICQASERSSTGTQFE